MPEAKKNPTTPGNRSVWPWVLAAGLGVMAAQWWLVARAGTDIPFWDQWETEGRWLYPAWRDGTLRLGDLFQAHNEHHIVWTNLLNLSLFVLNGQWDPLLQMAVGAALHAFAAGFLVGELAAGMRRKVQGGLAAGVALAFLPLAAWQNALWGFQSQAYFALIFSLMALAWLAPADRSQKRLLVGLAAGLAAMLSMGPGELVPVALLGLAVLRMAEKRRLEHQEWRGVWPALVLLAVAVALTMSARASPACSPIQFAAALTRALAWPHVEQPLAALVLNIPLMLVVMGRITHRRQPRPGEDFVLLLGGWAIANALAMAWARASGGEFQRQLPSRYVDFIVLLPLANAWCAVVLAAESTGQGRMRARVLTAVWCGFLFLGWLGVSLETWHDIVQLRIQDRLAPVRLAVAFQSSGDATVFAGQPRLYVPHPSTGMVLNVLHDPRMQGVLPPSFQPKQPMGSLSCAVRTLMGQEKDAP